MNRKRVHTPEGVRDVYGLEGKKRLKLQEKLSKGFGLYGYENILTPTFEFFDIFNSEKGTVSSKDMYKFFDREGNTLVLRPDITPSIARCVAKYYDGEDMALRLSYAGNVFLNSSSYQLKLKETCQLGAELINDDSPYADSEVIAMAIDSMKASGLNEFRISIGQVEFFQGLFDQIDDEEITSDLREFIINKNYFGLIEYVEGLLIPQKIKDVFLQFNELNGDVSILDRADTLVSNETSKQAIRRLREVYHLLTLYGLEEYVSFDLGMLSKHNYYTGIIFKGYTYGTGDAVLKGGRYDNLIEQFGKKAPSIGFAIVLDELMMALERQNIEMEAEHTDMMVLYMEELMEVALSVAKKKRLEKTSVLLERKDAKRDMEAYFMFSKQHSIDKILHLTSETTGVEIDVKSGMEKAITL